MVIRLWTLFLGFSTITTETSNAIDIMLDEAYTAVCVYLHFDLRRTCMSIFRWHSSGRSHKWCKRTISGFIIHHWRYIMCDQWKLLSYNLFQSGFLQIHFHVLNGHILWDVLESTDTWRHGFVHRTFGSLFNCGIYTVLHTDTIRRRNKSQWLIWMIICNFLYQFTWFKGSQSAQFLCTFAFYFYIHLGFNCCPSIFEYFINTFL